MTVQLGVTIGIATLQLLLGALGALIWTRDKERREEIRELRKAHDTCKSGLPQLFVFKDDFVRSVVKLEQQVQIGNQTITEVRDLLVKHITKEEAR